ncbi:hypothetical protein DFH09DRAFT_1302157 [Mycena vulgaris]|nr:hypothetical protein DFH09DRAFT_1302157 [Mycena vulgaris]
MAAAVGVWFTENESGPSVDEEPASTALPTHPPTRTARTQLSPVTPPRTPPLPGPPTPSPPPSLLGTHAHTSPTRRFLPVQISYRKYAGLFQAAEIVPAYPCHAPVLLAPVVHHQILSALDEWDVARVDLVKCGKRGSSPHGGIRALELGFYLVTGAKGCGADASG